jgi:hypothetical protein
MPVDPLGRAAHRAIDTYCSATKPNARLEHAIFDSVMTLVAARSVLVVRVQVGGVVISRGFVK